MTLKEWSGSRQLRLVKKARRQPLRVHLLRYDGFFVRHGLMLIGVAFQRLTQWFINRAAAARSGSRRDTLAWVPLLQRLHQIRNPRPRRRTTVQQFMADYAPQVNAAFVTRYGDGNGMNPGHRMNLRHDVAKALLNKEYSHLIKELDAKAKAQHDAEVEEWNLILDDISLASDVSQYGFSPLFLDFKDLFAFLVPETLSSTPCTPFLRQLVPMLGATSHLSLGMPRKTKPTRGSSLRKSCLSLQR